MQVSEHPSGEDGVPTKNEGSSDSNPAHEAVKVEPDHSIGQREESENEISPVTEDRVEQSQVWLCIIAVAIKYNA